MLCGGVTPGLKPITPEVQAIANKHKAHAEEQLGKHFSTWNAVGFSTQVVAGINYWIKIQVGDNQYVHIKVYQPLPHTGLESSLTKAEGGKTHADTFV